MLCYSKASCLNFFNRDAFVVSDSVFFFLISPSAGVEEDSAGPNGSSAEPWLRPACGRLHSQVSGETQHGHLPH